MFSDKTVTELRIEAPLAKRWGEKALPGSAGLMQVFTHHSSEPQHTLMAPFRFISTYSLSERLNSSQHCMAAHN